MPPTVAGQTDGELAAVSCAIASSCFAVGTYSGQHHVDRNLVENWHGMGWSLRRTPAPRNDNGFDGVSCPAATSCMAVGGSSSVWADHLSNGSWRLEHLPAIRGPVRWLRAISCSGPHACMAVGLSGQLTDSQAVAEQWSGRRWSRDEVPLPRASFGAELKGVSCTRANACVAVGDYGAGTGGGGEKVLAERWNGRRWRLMRAPNPSGDGIELNGVSCSSPSWCEAAGDYARSFDSTFFGLIETWNGKRWTIAHVAAPAARPKTFELEAISCPRLGACTAVGDSADRQLRSYVLAEHLIRGRWSVQSTPNPTSLGGTLSGVSCTSGGDCVAVGWQQAGDVFSPQLQFAERFS